MKKSTLTLLAALAAASALTSPALAQAGPPPGYSYYDRDQPGGWDIGRRIDWLQERINRGQADGSLDASEHHRVERELNEIRETAREMKWRNGGWLNEEQRNGLYSRLDVLSQHIRWLRSNDQRQPWLGGPVGPVIGGQGGPPIGVRPAEPAGNWDIDRRVGWLQDRIDRGRSDGSLNRREYRRVQRELNEIRETVRQMKWRNGGWLNDEQRDGLYRRLDVVGQHIHWLRSNVERQPW